MRAGDTVKHGPTDETWTVAFADHNSGKISWSGWPPNGYAEISDCTIIRSCTDEEHLATLLEWSMSKGTDDIRARTCERQLRKLEEDADIAFCFREPEWLAERMQQKQQRCELMREQIVGIKLQIKHFQSERQLMENAHYKMTRKPQREGEPHGQQD